MPSSIGPAPTNPPPPTHDLSLLSASLARCGLASSYRKLRCFSGAKSLSRDEDSYPVWIEHVKGQMDEWQDLDDSERRKRIREALHPPASSIISDLRLENPNANSQDYLRALDLAFGDTDSDDELFVRFHNTVVAEDEPPSDYLARLQYILRQVVRRVVVKAQDANRSRLQQFIRGVLYDEMLLVNLQLRDKLAQPPSCLGLLSSVRKQEEENKVKATLSGRRPSGTKPKSVLHHRVGTYTPTPAPTPQPAQPHINLNNDPSPPHAPSPHPLPNQASGTVICFKCGEVGHISRMCSNSKAAPELLNQRLTQFILQNQGNGKGPLENTKGTQ